MWLFPTKKQVQKEFKKITSAFRKRDKDILETNENLKALKSEMISKKEVDLMIREAMLKVQPIQYTGLNPETKSEPNPELNTLSHKQPIQ